MKPLQGIFCANFASSRDGWPPCRQAWHGQCYECLGQNWFPLAVLHDEDASEWVKQGQRARRLNSASDGVHAVMPFQCEVCWIRNLTGREMCLPADFKLQQCIRRANLDAFAGRAKTTIATHIRGVKNSIEFSSTLNKPPSLSLTPRGPLPVGDTVGMSLAVEMLIYSASARGRIKQHIQFDTMRKLRSTFSRSWDSSPVGITEGAAFSKGTGKVRLTSCASQSQWFSDFLLGAQDRMGYDTKKQLPLSIRAIVKLLELVKLDADDKEAEEARQLWKFGALVAILTAASLRGYEGFYLDLAATRAHITDGKSGLVPPNFKKKQILTETEIAALPSVCVCLIGKFKGETGERYHSVVLANTSLSGLTTRWWVEKLLQVCEEEGRTSGFAFAEANGDPPDVAEYNAMLRHYLRRMQVEHEDLFSPKEEVTRYGISRTFRKSAVTRADRAGLPESDLNAVNRWRTIERAKGTRPKHNMKTHYTDARALAPLTWRYSYVL